MPTIHNFIQGADDDMHKLDQLGGQSACMLLVSYGCLVTVLWLFLMVPWLGLQCDCCCFLVLCLTSRQQLRSYGDGATA